MATNREALLCRYHYDPLDRLVACTPSEQASAQRFYLKNRLATEIQASVQRSIFQQEDQLLAQHQRQSGSVETTLLATDQQRSVLNALAATGPHLLAYTPYGHRAPQNGFLSLLGFNGERPDPVTGCYLLGNGYRAFNPVLMRFNSPDSWSPFGAGGLNAYAYCVGDPVNQVDPTGHTLEIIKRGLRFIGVMRKSPSAGGTTVQTPLSVSSPTLLPRKPSFTAEIAELKSEKLELARTTRLKNKAETVLKERRDQLKVLSDKKKNLIERNYDVGTSIPETIKTLKAEARIQHTKINTYKMRITDHETKIKALNDRISDPPTYDELFPHEQAGDPANQNRGVRQSQ